MKEYNLNSITLPKWPELVQISEERWQRTWKIKLNEPLVNNEKVTMLQNVLSNDEISVVIRSSGEEVEVVVTTLRWGWDVDLIANSYQILESINNQLCEIKTIQDQPRNIWPPWARKNK